MSAPSETRLAVEYVRTLQALSGAAGAVNDPAGDWFYLSVKAGELATAATRLAEEAGRAADAARRGTATPRPGVVREQVAWYGRRQRLAHLLHPAVPAEDGAGRPGVVELLESARAHLATLPPDRRAVIDQNAEMLRRRLPALGLPLDPTLLAAFLLGAAEVDHHTSRSGQPADQVAYCLTHAAAQLAAPLADADQVAGLEAALARPNPEARR
jgi:hypothetical protein